MLRSLRITASSTLFDMDQITEDAEKSLETRQAVGIILLLPLLSQLIFKPLFLLEDLDGMSGLILAAAVGCVVPRPWMPVALRWIAVYFAFLTVYWIPWDGRFNLKTLPILFAFAIAAISMWLASKVATRRQESNARPEID